MHYKKTIVSQIYRHSTKKRICKQLHIHIIYILSKCSIKYSISKNLIFFLTIVFICQALQVKKSWTLFKCDSVNKQTFSVTFLTTRWQNNNINHFLGFFIALKNEYGKLFWSQGAERDNDFALSGKDTYTHTHTHTHTHTQT